MKDTITVYVDVNNRYTETIVVNKIVSMSQHGDWTTIKLSGSDPINVHHSVDEVKAMMGAN